MKKLLFAALFTLAAFAVKAQTVTQAQLQGKWRMTGFTDKNGTVDVVAGTWKLTNPEGGNKEMLDAVYKEVVDVGRETLVTINGNSVTQIVGGTVQKDMYTLENKDGKTYITINDGAGGMYLLFFNEGRLHYCVEELKMEFIYIKAE